MTGEHDIPDGLPALGTVLDGKYRIDRLLGVGGMGAVLEAMHLSLEERVAIKVLLGELAQDAELVGRFTREAWAAAKIKSENVARVQDVGTLPSGAPYLVMEYLEGCDLEQLQRDRGALPVAEVVDYVLQACHALAEAHEQGIIHRDLKPGNLFRVQQPDGSPLIKVVDFGISKVGAAGDVTKTGTLMGSPVYMAPEQLVCSKGVDVTADVWSLGVIVFELIAGRAPFDGKTLPEICTAVMSAPTPPLSRWAPGAPAELDAVIARCLEKDAEERYPNLAELAAALAPFGGPKATRSAEYVARVLGKTTQKLGTPRAVVGAAPRAPSSSETAATALGATPTFEPPAPLTAVPTTGPGIGTVLVALAALAVVGGLGLWLTVSSDEPSPVDAPSTSVAVSPVPTADEPEPEEAIDEGDEPAPSSAEVSVVPPSSAPPRAAPPPAPPPVPTPVAAPPVAPQPSPPTDGWGKHGRSR